MSDTNNTPRTDAAIKESDGQWSFALRDVSRELERELAQAIKERDEAIVEMEKCNDLSERAVKEAEKWNKSAMEQNTSLHREIALRIIAEQQLATAKEALERIAEEDGRPMSMRVTTCGNLAKQALAAIKPNQGEQP